MVEIKTPAACELGNSQLPKLIDLTCCSWMQLSVFVVSILLLWGCVCVYNGWISTPLAGWLADGWDEKNVLHVNLRIQNFQNSWTWLVVVGCNFRFCVCDCSMPQLLNDWLMTENTWFASTHTHKWCTWSYTIPNSSRFQLLQMDSTFNSVWLLCVCVCVWWLATPLAYWFPQHRECVATTNSGMWPKSKIAELNLSMPIERWPEATSKFLVFILKPITIPPSSNLATLFWNV